MARWVKAFNEGRQTVADMHRAARPSVSEEVHAVAALVDSDRNPPIILHDNARAHTAQAVAALFVRWDWEVLYRPPYYPDL